MTEKQDEVMSREDAMATLKLNVETWNIKRRNKPDWDPDLSDADLQGLDLSGAKLENAELRRCRDLRLDGQFIRNAKFSAFQREPYCIIRRTYTGPKQVLILLALVVFVLPFVSKALF